MKKLKYLFLLCLIFLPIRINAEETEFTLFDSNIIVNQDRTLDITENYKVYFIEDINKLTRKLNTRLIEIRPDKSSVQIDSKITDINSETSFELENKNKMTNINFKIEGYQDEIEEYSLSYKFNLGKDTTPKYDELYYDIVSNMDTTISNLTFSITLPDNINKKNIFFSIDGKYNLTEDDVNYEIVDNKIVGSLNKLLENNQTFSVYIKFNNDYFKGATDNFNYFSFLLLLIPFISLGFIFITWCKYGKNNSLNIKRIDYVPNNFDSAEIGYLYKGKLDGMDLTSLLIYLANQGYLQIIEHDDGYKLNKENSFKFIKLKDYDRNNAAQKIIFENLFRDDDVAELQEIEYNFAEIFKEAKSMLDNEDNKKKLFFSDLDNKKIISIILIALSVITINFNSIYLFTNTYWLIPIISTLLMLGLYIIFLSDSKTSMKLLIGGAIIITCLYIGINPLLIQTKMLIIYIIGMVLIFTMCTFYIKLSKRTPYGNQVLSEAYGLKYYLETLTIDELNDKQEQNPNFYFDMIPYAYVLESLDIWIQKGSKMTLLPPSWYVMSSEALEFKLNNFEKFIKNVLYTTALVMMKQSYSEYGNVEYSNTKIKTNLND